MRNDVYFEMFPLAEDATPYRLLTSDYVAPVKVNGHEILQVDPAALTMLADQAMRDCQHLLRPGHLAQLRKIIDDPEASANDRFVAFELLKNATISAAGVLPMCQDTGTAIIMGKKGENVWTGGGDEAALSEGILKAYTETNLRYSQVAPLDMYNEVNTGTNLPAQIDIYATAGNAYKFMFMAKGGGSANKTFLYQETKALLNPTRLRSFLDEKIRTLGTAACPPYHLAIVIGGTSAELTLKTVKLASARYLDGLPTAGNKHGQAFRDVEMEAEVHRMTQAMGIGAQFGGKYFCHDVRVIRLPRHGASCPVGIGVSCSADRQVLGKISRDGVFLEQLEREPGKYLPDVGPESLSAEVVHIDLNRPMAETRATLSRYPIKTRVSLTGPLDRRPRHRPRQAQGAARRRPGPAAVLQGPRRLLRRPGKDARRLRLRLVRPDHGRADGRVRRRLSGRRRQPGDAGQGQPLAAGDDGVQGPRRLLSWLHRRPGGAPRPGLHPQGRVHRVPELGMEAIWRIEVEDFPAFVVVDDKGNDFFAEFMKPGGAGIDGGRSRP